MRIDNWPLDRVMRLPDWCFGRRYWVGQYIYGLAGGVDYGIAEENLPDKFVVWGVMASSMASVMIRAIELTIRLGTFLPVNDADLYASDRLLKGISTPAMLYELFVIPNGVTWINCERMLIESAGRRITIGTRGDTENAYTMTVGVQISAMPKEVPDWLISGQGKNLL